ncbi:MAG: hypothetical protein QOI92_1652 [Chloroflexota bacterium]|jgi:uncharacterized BrkB/YihY/UPF0761 family membrane protein|nr:hypothetical protein [Chloroflexota bacterium]
MSEGMTPASGSAPMPEKVNLAYHAIIGTAVGVTAAFTALAWVPAIVVGYIVGRDQAERAHGIKARPALSILRALGIVVGVGLMLLLGAIVGGLVAIIIVALVAFSERLAANVTANDQMIARILVVLLGTVIWMVFFFVFQPNIHINVGG